MLKELLNYWAKVTDELIAQTRQAETPQSQLSNLFAAIASAGVSGEEVIQVWAKQDKQVADVVHVVEKKRIAYLQEIFISAGFTKSQAKERAGITYLTFLGYAFKSSQDLAFSLDFKDLGQEVIKVMFERSP